MIGSALNNALWFVQWLAQFTWALIVFGWALALLAFAGYIAAIVGGAMWVQLKATADRVRTPSVVEVIVINMLRAGRLDAEIQRVSHRNYRRRGAP